MRSRVEHVFGVMKLKFEFVKVRYRGLKKNANRLFATCALVLMLDLLERKIRLLHDSRQHGQEPDSLRLPRNTGLAEDARQL